MKIIKRTDHFNQIQSLYDQFLKETESQLLPEYRRVYQETLTKLRGIYWEIQEAIGDNTLLVSDLYRYDKYYKVLNELQAKIYQLGGTEKLVLEDKLVELYKVNSRIIGSEFGVPPLSDSKAIEAMNTIWCQDGKLWSNRIWEHKSQLVNLVEQGMVNTIATGSGSRGLAKAIKTAFGTSWYDAQRLARTELSHIMNAAALDQYSEAGVEYYKVLVADGPCIECEELSKKEFPVNELVIPAHPNCRCCTIAVMR